METLFIPNESDFKRWVKEAVTEFITEHKKHFIASEQDLDSLVNRKEIAKFLRVSLPTLTDWIKRGLPSHPQRGRVYFDKNEVITYIKEKKLRQLKIGSKLHHLKQELS
ncbi:helix-turn-helix domain-containing protein [Ferruginibacter sp.]|nr:helix-turn-helix domain-containing protein [Ferruginibacter sp.]